jgi:hypothetical protein
MATYFCIISNSLFIIHSDAEYFQYSKSIHKDIPVPVTAKKKEKQELL